MAIGVRIEPELEQQLDQLARSMGKSRSACVREAITQYLQRFSTSDEALLRIPVDPSDSNGRLKPSQLMADKLFTAAKTAIGTVMGQLETPALAELDLALRSWLELS